MIFHFLFIERRVVKKNYTCWRVDRSGCAPADVSIAQDVHLPTCQSLRTHFFFQFQLLLNNSIDLQFNLSRWSLYNWSSQSLDGLPLLERINAMISLFSSYLPAHFLHPIEGIYSLISGDEVSVNDHHLVMDWYCRKWSVK